MKGGSSFAGGLLSRVDSTLRNPAFQAAIGVLPTLLQQTAYLKNAVLNHQNSDDVRPWVPDPRADSNGYFPVRAGRRARVNGGRGTRKRGGGRRKRGAKGGKGRGKGRKKGGSSGGRVTVGGNTKPNVSLVRAPVSNGICMSSMMMMRAAGRPEPCDEYEPGTRLVGNTILHFTSTTTPLSGLGTKTLMKMNASDPANPWDINSGSVLGFTRRLTPSNMGYRVAYGCIGFRFYAWRKIKLTYIPQVPTSTPGALAFAILRDAAAFVRVANTVADPLNTPEGMLSYVPSAMTPVWEPCCIDYQYHGKKVWSLWSASSTASDVSGEVQQHIQALVGAVGTGIAASTEIGRFMVEYVLDLYEPGNPLDVTTNLTSAKPDTPMLSGPSFPTMEVDDERKNIPCPPTEHLCTDKLAVRSRAHGEEDGETDDDSFTTVKPLHSQFLVQKADGSVVPLGDKSFVPGYCTATPKQEEGGGKKSSTLKQKSQ